MDYELCKELKDAGFVQYGKGFNTTPVVYKEKFYESVYEPTLSERIEACGKDFGGLTQSSGDSVFTWKVVDRNNENGQLANTPEEAVAKLWLAIHSQKLKDSKDNRLEV